MTLTIVQVLLVESIGRITQAEEDITPLEGEYLYLFRMASTHFRSDASNEVVSELSVFHEHLEYFRCAFDGDGVQLRVYG